MAIVTVYQIEPEDASDDHLRLTVLINGDGDLELRQQDGAFVLVRKPDISDLVETIKRVRARRQQ